MDTFVCWEALIRKEMELQNDSWNNLVDSTMDQARMNKLFRHGCGDNDCPAFTLWTQNRVYFPIMYDNEEAVASVSRNPDNVPTLAIGINLQ